MGHFLRASQGPSSALGQPVGKFTWIKLVVFPNSKGGNPLSAHTVAEGVATDASISMTWVDFASETFLFAEMLIDMTPYRNEHRDRSD